MASGPYRHRRTGALIALLVGLVALAGVYVVVLRPGRIIGVESGPLAASLSDELDDVAGVACGETGRGWRCRVGSGARGTLYAIDVDGWGCWEASAGDGGRGRQASACIWITDYF